MLMMMVQKLLHLLADRLLNFHSRINYCAHKDVHDCPLMRVFVVFVVATQMTA